MSKHYCSLSGRYDKRAESLRGVQLSLHSLYGDGDVGYQLQASSE